MVQQSGNLSGAERAVSAFIGLSLSVIALRRGNPWLRALAGVTSSALMARAAAGHCGVKAALSGQASLGEGLSQQWGRLSKSPAPAREAEARSGVKDDQSAAVDSAVNDSFPASDPPASHQPDVPPSNAAAKWAAARDAEDIPPDVVQT
jgi:hypothetical protein